MHGNSIPKYSVAPSASATSFLDALAKELEIPDSAYDEAESRYKSVGEWLCREKSTLKSYLPVVHIQGSFALGTAIRPVSEDEDYDIDMVAEIRADINKDTQSELKKAVTFEMEAYARAYSMKATEPKRRCVRLVYADGAQFHIDVTPAVPNWDVRKQVLKAQGIENPWVDQSIAITDEKHWAYNLVNPNWPNSNPRGYLKWFRWRMATAFEQRKKAMALSARKNVEDIPDYKVKTPLQSAIQILKRHRDMTHEGELEDRPISIIITTLAALSYSGEANIAGALYAILNKMDSFIQRVNGQAVIMNPTDPQENFADKWKDHPERESAFYEWLAKARNHFYNIATASDLRSIGESMSPLLGPKLVEKAVNSSVSSSSLLLREKWSLSNPTHKQALLWPLAIYGKVQITDAKYLRNGFRWQTFKSGGNALPKNCNLLFTAETNVPLPYEVWWQVVNTGDEAKRANGLRGRFDAGTVDKGKLERRESTSYQGSHSIECFIIKNGYCVASSGLFIVNIQ